MCLFEWEYLEEVGTPLQASNWLWDGVNQKRFVFISWFCKFGYEQIISRFWRLLYTSAVSLLLGSLCDSPSLPWFFIFYLYTRNWDLPLFFCFSCCALLLFLLWRWFLIDLFCFLPLLSLRLFPLPTSYFFQSFSAFLFLSLLPFPFLSSWNWRFTSFHSFLFSKMVWKRWKIELVSILI